MQPQRWRVVAASARGTRHEKTGQPCQDAHQWCVLPGHMLVAALADGAGSAALAEVGSALAVQHAIQQLSQIGGESLLKADEAGLRSLLTAVVQTARDAVVAEAATRQLPPRELATTLIVVVATPDRVAAAQIGDGAVVVEGDGNFSALTSPGTTEYLNETTFLTSTDALARIQVAVRPGHSAHLAALSDGLQMVALKMPEGVPHAPFFRPLLRLVDPPTPLESGADQLAAFLRSPRLGARTDDDLTLLLAASS